MERKIVLNYINKNFKDIDFNDPKEVEIAKKYVDIFIKEELYLKNKNLEELEAFIHVYTNLKILEKNIDIKVETTNPKTSKKKFKVLRYIDTYRPGLFGSCSDEKINIELTNYLIRSLYRSDKKNFASLIETINHELKHADNNKKNIIKYNLLTEENYYTLRFNLLQLAAGGFYHEYYKNFEEEIGAFIEGYKSIINTFEDNEKYELIIKDYKNKLKEAKSLRCRDFYDVANINCMDQMMLREEVRNNIYYMENKDLFLIEYDKNGERRRINEIIENKYKQLDLLNKLIMENPNDEYLLNILNNKKTEEVFNKMGYISIMKDDFFMEVVNENNKKDILKILNFGLNYENNRLNENNNNTKDYFDKLNNEKYIKNKIKKINEKINFINDNNIKKK
jgi:hypothetical protein